MVCRVHFAKRLRRDDSIRLGYDHTIGERSELGYTAKQVKARLLAESATRLWKGPFRDS